MNKETFFTMTIEDRVKAVNKMLQDYSLSEIAEKVGIPSSSFSKIMREGDYLYHQGEKKFFPFIRSENDRRSANTSKKSNTNDITFVKENIDVLKRIVNAKGSNDTQLILDERIYGSKATYVNKNLRMNKEIYEDFANFCNKNFPGLTLQHLCSQALIDFIYKYEKSQ
ncbi:hypothetical protein [Mesobacillus subterraneus]|uniref:Uncharacterized protein n=1 Tax=Mesobacillus subterraneus TaxID=285983 RepID=A0A0D6Z9M5_9BACI|nr:hypothetical protein [Mesobacillus subterraneus]KIY22060.1 hypothetical protein UB32_10560 [Mesobacillus subterraneus]